MPEIYQIEPSYDDLAFEPKMSWKDLKNWAKDFCKDNAIYFDIFPGENHCFWAGELCFFDCGYIKDVSGLALVSKKRTFEQMKAVIKSLCEE